MASLLPKDYPGFFAPWGKHSPGWKLLPKPLRSIRNWTRLIAALVILLIIRTYVVWIYYVPSASMEPTLMKGDWFIAWKSSYGIRSPEWLGIPGTRFRKNLEPRYLLPFQSPEPGDIVLFRLPHFEADLFIKRVAAVEGDTIRAFHHQKKVPDDLFASGKSVSSAEAIENQSESYPATKSEMRTMVMPEDHVFLLGDNRDNSIDSRYWGPLPKSAIMGKATRIVFSIDKFMLNNEVKCEVRWDRIGKPLTLPGE